MSHCWKFRVAAQLEEESVTLYIDQRFDFVKSGGSVVYIEGSQVIISKIFSSSFSVD